MKRIFTILALLSASLSGFAQKTDSKSYDELMRLSRRARTTSTILVATGPVIAAGGIGTLIYGLIKNEDGSGDAVYDQSGNFIGYSTKKYTTQIVIGAAGALVGIGMALTSIAFTNKAYDLRREARKAKLKTSIDQINIPGFGNSYAGTGTSQYKLSLAFSLGR